MPDNLENQQPPVLRRRKGDQGIEKTRIENGEKTIIPEKGDTPILSEKEKKAIENKDIEEKLKAEIQGFLAKKR